MFITPMPLLRLMDALGVPHLKNLDEAVRIMRAAMLDVIQVITPVIGVLLLYIYHVESSQVEL